MNIGMLWFDNDPKSDLNIKLSRAILYYRNKYGQDPNLCFVHPSMINGAETKSMDIELKPNRSVLPNHFWIGIQANSNSPTG